MQLAMRHPWILLVMLALAAAEFAWRKRRRGYDLAAAGASLGVAVGQAVLRPISGLAIAAIFLTLAQWAPFQFPANDWRTWAAGFFAVEFAYYWFHRASHRVRWMWATHAVHHSASEMVLPAAIRLGWTELLSLGWMFFGSLILLGFPPLVVAVLLALNLIYQFPLHTEAVGRLGPLEWVLNTPSHHRAHHSRDEAFLDCNFGGTLIVFDRLFGTFRAEPVEGGLHYGLYKRETGNNPFRIALGEWRVLLTDLARAPNWRERLRIAVSAP